MKKISQLLTLLAVFAVFLGTSGADEVQFKSGQKVDLRIAGVPGEDQLLISNVYTISGNGTLNLPELGELRVVGLTQGTLQQRIQDAYKQAQIFTNPTIIINVDSGDMTTRVITLTGEVERSGPIAYRSGITLLDAIGAAGGFTDYANQRNIVLMRNGRTTEHDYSSIASKPGQDIELKPDDKILVRPRRLFR
ncbi:N/A [soil metagenome]